MVTDQREIGLTAGLQEIGWLEVIFHLAPFYGWPRLNRYFGALKRAKTALPLDYHYRHPSCRRSENLLIKFLSGRSIDLTSSSPLLSLFAAISDDL